MDGEQTTNGQASRQCEGGGGKEKRERGSTNDKKEKYLHTWTGAQNTRKGAALSEPVLCNTSWLLSITVCKAANNVR